MAPSWPGRGEPGADIRKHPPSELARLTFEEVTEQYAAIARGMQEKPVIIGHSIGGIIAQVLLQRGLGVAGVAIASPPPRGQLVFAAPSLIVAWALLAPELSISLPYVIKYEAFKFAFVNDLPEIRRKRAYLTYVSPESLRVARGSLDGVERMTFRHEHVPLLFIAGGADRIAPSGAIHSTVAEYLRGSKSVADFQLYGAQSHLGLLIGRDWELVAEGVLAWVDRRTREARALDTVLR